MPFAIHSVQVVLLVVGLVLTGVGVLLSRRRGCSVGAYPSFVLTYTTVLDERVCVTCGLLVMNSMECFRCGRPVHLREPECGGWILDWWHDSACDAVDGNEFWCRACLKEVYDEEER